MAHAKTISEQAVKQHLLRVLGGCKPGAPVRTRAHHIELALKSWLDKVDHRDLPYATKLLEGVAEELNINGQLAYAAAANLRGYRR